ncbi:MAG: hypothetical protein IJG05_03845, partial [Solobacterium sp.]|nr:hypothetical protein [Solobacterium sp.]
SAGLCKESEETIMTEKKKGYQPSHCSGCSNQCHLSSPRCMIGMRYKINIGWKEPEKTEKKDENPDS